jgi:hypothetical protein
MSCQFRVLDYIYAFEGVTPTASSASADFPVANLNAQTRSSVWRSTGNYVVDATNDKIDFKESGGGPELTATLTSGTYTELTFAAEIKAQLEAIGAETYTVSRSSSNGKWTISGGAFLSLLFSTGTNAATSCRSLIGYGSSDYTGSSSYVGAAAAWHSEEWVKFDLSTSEAVDSVVLLFDKVDGSKLSGSAVVQFQGNATDSWSSPALNQTLTYDEVRGIYSYYFTSDQTYRFFRVRVVDTQNPSGYVEIAKILFGKATQFLRLPSEGFDYGIVDQSKEQSTAYGHKYFDLYPLRSELMVDFSYMTYADAESLIQIFEALGTTEPIFCVIDPLESSFDKDRFAIYGRIDSNLKAKHKTLNYFDLDMKIVEII